MKFLSVCSKSLREQLRDRWSLLLMLTLAPAFVFLYWLFFGGGSTTYRVLVINQDSGSAGQQVIDAMKAITYSNGQSILKVDAITDRAAAERQIRDRDAHALVIIPAGFSQSLHTDTPAEAILVGDLTNPYYSVAAIMASAAVDGTVAALKGQPRPVTITEEALGASGARTEFENYVPGLLVFAVIMIIFPVAMAVTREIEYGTLRRLQLTRMSAFDLLGGISAVQVGVGTLAIVCAFGVALLLGFESQGPVWVAMLVGALTSLSMIGVGLLVACGARTVNQAVLVANFPMMLMMFFSGSIFPVPGVTLFRLGGHSVGLYDILPPTHAVVALNKVLTLGEGLGDITYELSAVLVLSALYFAAGVGLFQRLYLRRG